MKTSRFTDSQVMAVLKQNEQGVPVPNLCREHGMIIPTPKKIAAISDVFYSLKQRI